MKGEGEGGRLGGLAHLNAKRSVYWTSISGMDHLAQAAFTNSGQVGVTPPFSVAESERL